MNAKILLRTVSAYLRTKLGAYVRPRRYAQIFAEIEGIKPKNIMEIGTWNGVRAKQMIEYASRFFPSTEIRYFGFDLFECLTQEMYEEEVSKKPPTRARVLNYLESTGAQIRLFSGDTRKTLGSVDALPKMDIIFIDGGHMEATVLNDWNWAQKVMDSKTVVIFDDYWHNRVDGPRKVIDRINRRYFNVQFLPKVDVFFNPDFGKLVISLVKVTRIH